MRQRLQLIGGVERHEHYYLRQDHRCYFWGEYTPWEYTGGLNCDYSETNRLIADFKAPIASVNSPDWDRKQSAIERISSAFAGFWKWSALAPLTLLVPIPPSRARWDAHFDDRMTQVLHRIRDMTGANLDIRELIVGDGSIPMSHTAERRPKLDDIVGSLSLADLPATPPRYVYLFDDVLTTGAHFVACSMLLRKRFPEAGIVGNFVARCSRPAPGTY